MKLLWDNPPASDGDTIGAMLSDARAAALAERLVGHVNRELSEIDRIIESTSRTWRVARMDRIDRNLLRLATAELQHEPDTPRAVILAEAVRLAGRYGSERSVRFVNGLVEALAQHLRPPATDA